MATATSTNTTDKAKDCSFAGFKASTLDMDAFWDSYKKNLEILGLINKMSMEVCTGIAKLQTTFFKQAMEDFGGIFSSKPSETASKFSEVTQNTLNRAIGNGKQISEIVTAANKDISTVASGRLKDSFEEAKKFMGKK
ncbi:MAG: hypothetical protein LBT70_00805 [Holosporaceae bacterium]|jgi:hypothetical protein|nr:hypothetical protein [Holosporaceae bacterium]